MLQVGLALLRLQATSESTNFSTKALEIEITDPLLTVNSRCDNCCFRLSS